MMGIILRATLYVMLGITMLPALVFVSLLFAFVDVYNKIVYGIPFSESWSDTIELVKPFWNFIIQIIKTGEFRIEDNEEGV